MTERPQKPRPITLRAYLPLPGAHRATLHKHVATRRIRVDGEAAWEHVFKCTETGVERRWGLDAIGTIAHDPDAEVN